jgi:hypothetical protein
MIIDYIKIGIFLIFSISVFIGLNFLGIDLSTQKSEFVLEFIILALFVSVIIQIMVKGANSEE